MKKIIGMILLALNCNVVFSITKREEQDIRYFVDHAIKTQNPWLVTLKNVVSQFKVGNPVDELDIAYGVAGDLQEVAAKQQAKLETLNQAGLNTTKLQNNISKFRDELMTIRQKMQEYGKVRR